VGALDCAAPHRERFRVRQDKLSNDDRVKFVEDNIDQVLPRPPHAFGSGVANEEIRSCTTLIFFMRSKRHPHFSLSEDLRNPATRRWAEAPREGATAAVSRSHALTWCRCPDKGGYYTHPSFFMRVRHSMEARCHL
jgi:hypothetical protein